MLVGVLLICDCVIDTQIMAKPLYSVQRIDLNQLIKLVRYIMCLWLCYWYKDYGKSTTECTKNWSNAFVVNFYYYALEQYCN